MKKHILILLFSIFAFFNAFSQNKFDDLIEKADNYIYISPDTTIFYAKKAEEIGKNNNNKKSIALSLQKQGIGYYHKSNLSEAKSKLSEALAIFESIEDENNLALTYKLIGDTYRELSSQLEISTEYYVKALELYEKTDELNGKSEVLLALGILSQEIQNWGLAADYYIEASEIKEELEEPESVAFIMHKLGQVTIGSGKVEEGLQSCLTSLAFSRENGYKITAAIILNDLATMFNNTGDYERAKRYLLESLEYNKELGNIKEEVHNFIGLSTNKYLQKIYKEAHSFADSAITIAMNNNLNSSAYYKAYELKALAYKNQGKISNALDYFIMYEEQEDSIFNADKSKQINELKIAYDTEKKEREIQNLKLEQERITVSQQRRTITFILVITGLLLIIALVFFNMYRQKRKAAIELEKANKEIEKADKLKSEILANMSHEIKTPLSFINSSSALIKMEYNGTGNDDLNEVFDGLDTGVNRLNRTIDLFIKMAELKSGNYKVDINQVDFNELIESELSIFQEILISGERSIDLKYSNELENCVINADKYSISEIIRNLLDNAIKFTEKGSIVVNVEEGVDSYTLSVSDTGVGISKEYYDSVFAPFSQENMDLSRSHDGNGLGLAISKELSILNNSELSFESEKSKGSTFYLKVPKFNTY